MSRRSDLAVPKSGKSRFSKALPTVPGLDDYYYYDDDESESNIETGASDNHNSNNHNRNNSEFNLPARTSSLASPPPTKNLPLPPLPPQPPTKTLPATPQPNRSSNNKNNNSNTSSSDRYDTTTGQTSIAPSSTSSAAPSANVLSIKSPPLGGPSMMAIPRKPIANLQLPSPLPQYLAQPSPTFSLSSLLSAYMTDGDDSQRASYYETATSASETERQEVAAPGSEQPVAAAAAASAATFPPSKLEAPVQIQLGATGGSGSLPARPNAGAAAAASYQRPADRNLPPPPPKDDEAQKPKPSPPEPTATTATASSELATPSSPRPEIWKRRPHMSQASKELPGLKLDYSHGSTADTQLPSDAAASQAPPPDKAKAAPQRVPPFAGGLPGRNIRPSISERDQPPIGSQTMGGETSKLKQIKQKLGSQRSESVSSTSSAKAGFPGVPAVQRPPTPEYQKEDAKAPAVEPFISPVSPASSPEAPRGASPDFSKGLPPKPPKDEQTAAAIAGTQKPISRKALPISPVQDPTPVENPTRPPSDTNGAETIKKATVSPIVAKENVVPAPVASPPMNAASTHSRVSGDTAVMQPPPAVIQTSVQVARPPRSAPQATADPRLLRSDSRGLLYRGRDGTLYPEMKTESEPHPKAAYFPTQTYQSMFKDGIAKARPLTETHFGCFQQHRTMNRRSNRNCPLTCQTCDRADAEDRWVCTFCHLRICDACHRKLGSYQRDLRRLVDGLANSGPPGLMSQSRPGTALGLQATL